MKTILSNETSENRSTIDAIELSIVNVENCDVITALQKKRVEKLTDALTRSVNKHNEIGEKHGRTQHVRKNADLLEFYENYVFELQVAIKSEKKALNKYLDKIYA